MLQTQFLPVLGPDRPTYPIPYHAREIDCLRRPKLLSGLMFLSYLRRVTDGPLTSAGTFESTRRGSPLHAAFLCRVLCRTLLQMKNDFTLVGTVFKR